MVAIEHEPVGGRHPARGMGGLWALWIGGVLMACGLMACGDKGGPGPGEMIAPEVDTVADTEAEVGPDVASEVAPDVAPEVGPDVRPDVAPDVLDDTDSDTPVRAVAFNLTLPPETPRDAILEVAIDDDGSTRVERVEVSARVMELVFAVRGEASFEIEMVEPEALIPVALSGADTGLGRVSAPGATVAFEVLRWGLVGAGERPLWVPLVTVPSFTPSGPIHVSGNQAVLGAWDGVGLALYPALSGHAARVELAAGTTVEFKVTRGSWETVEKGPGGVEIPNRSQLLGAALTRTEVVVDAWRDLSGPPLTDPRIVHVPSFASTHLTPRRDLWIYLPPGYDSSPDKRYPVLYMHDGQNIFDGSLAAFGVAWEADDAADSGIAAGRVEPLIIVGIESTSDRMSEYTPVVDPEYGGGNAAAYGRFLVQELKPYIDTNYRTLTGPDDTGLLGSSLGGLVSLYLGLEYPGVFRRVGVVSPSVWWANKEIVSRVAGLTVKPPLFVWLDIGTAEGSGSAVGNTRELRDTMVGEGWALGSDLLYREYQGAQHNEASWAQRMPEILEALFPAR